MSWVHSAWTASGCLPVRAVSSPELYQVWNALETQVCIIHPFSCLRVAICPILFFFDTRQTKTIFQDRSWFSSCRKSQCFSILRHGGYNSIRGLGKLLDAAGCVFINKEGWVPAILTLQLYTIFDLNIYVFNLTHVRVLSDHPGIVQPSWSECIGSRTAKFWNLL